MGKRIVNTIGLITFPASLRPLKEKSVDQCAVEASLQVSENLKGERWKLSFFLSSFFVFAMLLPFCNTALSQQLNIKTIDSLSYIHYLNGNLKELVHIGKQAKNNNIDFYYLRMRMGILLFNNNQYRKAAHQFSTANMLESNDLVNEYLYFSLLWSGQKAQASTVRMSMTDSLKSRLNIPDYWIKDFDFNYTQYSINRDITIDNFYPSTGTDGYRLIPRQLSTSQLSLTHMLGNRIKIIHSAAYLIKDYYKYVLYLNTPDLNKNFQVNQFQYFVKASADVGKNYTTKASFHFLNYKYDGALEQNSEGEWVSNRKSDNDHIVSIGVLKNFNLFDIEGDVAYSTISLKNIWQESLLIRYLPWSNLNLYIENLLILKQENGKNQWITIPLIGCRLTNFAWLEYYQLFNTMNHFHLYDGKLVFNGYETIEGWNGINLIILPYPNIRLSAVYQQRKVSTVHQSLEIEQDPIDAIINKYHLISIGLSWHF